ncbi:hypothetical protein B0H10DRAFT_2187633 [Mycena sp. CBHHK59/15]|nr:hypothetical protein B0H10DRAFT_2187633 [Mycena sp. CBHHK59/15]
MAELMSTVFADRTVWKDHDGDLVLNLAPPGIIPSFEHLRRLKAYGYACRLYPMHSLHLHEIPMLYDFPLVELYAPKRVEVLNRWLSQADFRAKKNDVKVQGLTIQYFNLMRMRPSFPSLLPDEQLTEHEKNIPDNDPLARSLMFLMFLTGTQLLPAGDGRIEMTFFERFLDTDIDTRGPRAES